MKTDKIDVAYGPDSNEAVFSWTITYGDGKKEPFTGTAGDVFDHAMKTSKHFAVEKDGED